MSNIHHNTEVIATSNQSRSSKWCCDWNMKQMSITEFTSPFMHIHDTTTSDLLWFFKLSKSSRFLGWGDSFRRTVTGSLFLAISNISKLSLPLKNTLLIYNNSNSLNQLKTQVRAKLLISAYNFCPSYQDEKKSHKQNVLTMQSHLYFFKK